ncbi:MAG: AF1514 family protein [Thiobacillus sp.]|nr:AF1514 family protein [Thiobacillus sp.]
MKKVHIDYQGAELDYQRASLLAMDVARINQMQDPTIVSWHQNSRPEMPPVYDGADPDTWWAKYGAGNGGRLEVCLGDDFQFVMMDARGFEKLGEMPLRNLSDEQGNHYLCYIPMMNRSSDKPTPDACTHLDGWAADQF